MPNAMDGMSMETMENTEMMETESSMNKINQSDVVRDYLALARQLINDGKPSQALQAVVMAMRSQGGDDAVFHSLHRARELYITRLQGSNNAVDQLASLFAECAIAEAQPSKSDASVDTAIIPDAQRNSILAESGRNDIVLDAFADGSSFICLRCGGLVSKHRQDEHYAYWCCQI